MIFTIHTKFNAAPAFEPRCIRLESGQTAWLYGFAESDQLLYHGAERLPPPALFPQE